MKRFPELLCMIMAAMILAVTFSSCTETAIPDHNYDGQTVTSILLTPIGKMDFKDVKLNVTSDIDGCSHIWASTRGKTVDDNIIFSIYFEDVAKMEVGDKIKPENLTFGLVYSSNSFNFSNEYTGSIILKKKSNDSYVFRFKDVKFNLAAGVYTIDGDMKF